jgi:hypothetical protein
MLCLQGLIQGGDLVFGLTYPLEQPRTSVPKAEHIHRFLYHYKARP